MPRKNELEFANFVCKFGALDMDPFLDTILLPALLKREVVEGRGGDYFFLDSQLVDDPHDGVTDHLVVMRFARPKVVKRDIVMKGHEIEHSPAEMPVAGSGIMVLMLETHRLLYYPETLHAPGLQQFRSAAFNAIRDQRMKLIDAAVREYEETADSTVEPLDRVEARTAIAARYPLVDLQIVPLAGVEALEAALARFEKLREVMIRIAPKNAEIDNNPFFASLEKAHKAVGALQTSVTHRNADGLNREGARAEVVQAAGQGTAFIKLSGIDKRGMTLRVRDDEISFRVKANIPAGNLPRAAREMAAEFRRQLQAAKVEPPTLQQGFAQRVRAGIEKYRGRP